MALHWFFGSFANWRDAREMAQRNHHLALLPQALPSTAASNSSGTELADGNYRFEVPWPKPSLVKGRVGSTTYTFPGGQALALIDTTELIHVDKMPSDQKEFFAAFFGYRITGESFRMTPDQVSPWLTNEESARRSLLLGRKDVEMPSGEKISALYYFEEPTVRGFQIGDPSSDNRVEILCFDSSNRRVEAILSSKPSADPPLTQRDVNRVMQTLRSSVGGG